METIRITDSQITAFILVFFRTGAILFTAPFFGSKNIPIRVRILLSFMIAMVISSAITPYKSIGSYPKVILSHTGEFFIAVMREMLLGIAIGFIAQLTFVGIQMAGQFIGHEIGFGMMNVLDPTTRATLMVTAEYNTAVAMLIFLITYCHHYVLMGIARSFEAIPLARWELSASFIGHLNTTFAGIFNSALMISIPVMGTLFLTKVALAIIARTIPQMNVFIVGFPLQISVGLISMAISLPFFIRVILRLFLSMRSDIWFMFR